MWIWVRRRNCRRTRWIVVESDFTEGRVSVDELDARGESCVVLSCHMGSSWHDWRRPIGDETELLEIQGAGEGIQRLLLRVIDAEVFCNSSKFDGVELFEAFDDIFLETTLRMARIRTARTESPEPIRIREVALEDQLRFHAESTAHERDSLGEHGVHIDTIGAQDTVSGEDPDRPLPCGLQMIPIGDGVLRVEVCLVVTQNISSSGVNSLEDCLFTIFEGEDGRFEDAEVQRHTLRITPVAVKRTMILWVTVLACDQAAVMFLDGAVDETGTHTENDSISANHWKTTLVTEVFFEIDQHGRIFDTRLTTSMSRLEADFEGV
jgi:hypothetical protein